MGEQTTLFDIIADEETFDFECCKQNLIDNLDMLKEMSVEEQTLYKKWQEMNKGGKMAKIKNKLYTYRYNLWLPSDLDNLEKRFSKVLLNSIENYWSDENQNKLKLQRETINATYSWDVRSIEWKNFFNEVRELKV